MIKNKLIFGYDIMTYNGEIPNCLNPKFLNTIYNASDFYYSDSLEFFSNGICIHILRFLDSLT